MQTFFGVNKVHYGHCENGEFYVFVLEDRNNNNHMSLIHVCFCSERPFYGIERRCQMSLQLSLGDFQ